MSEASDIFHIKLADLSPDGTLALISPWEGILGDLRLTGSIRARSSCGIFGNIENSAFDVRRSVQVV